MLSFFASMSHILTLSFGSAMVWGTTSDGRLRGFDTGVDRPSIRTLDSNIDGPSKEASRSWAGDSSIIVRLPKLVFRYCPDVLADVICVKDIVDLLDDRRRPGGASGVSGTITDMINLTGKNGKFS